MRWRFGCFVSSCAAALIACSKTTSPTQSGGSAAETTAIPRSIAETGQFWERPPSFSFLVFEGDVRKLMPALLSTLGYRVLAQREQVGPGSELVDQVMGLDADSGLRRGQASLQKAYWFANGFTVLVDSELLLAEEAAIDTFCKENHTSMIAGTWERVSRTANVVEVSAAGVRKASYLEDGHPNEKAPPPHHPGLLKNPDPSGIRNELQAKGISLDQVFGRVTATVVTLEELATDGNRR
jgi:hypothetical protein